VIAEIVVNTMPRNRTRTDLHRHPHYYPIRNHLIDFLVDRSKQFDRANTDFDSRRPRLTKPGLTNPQTIPGAA
jgi:nitrate/nitrite transport system ATP-binding protein